MSMNMHVIENLLLYKLGREKMLEHLNFYLFMQHSSVDFLLIIIR